MTLKEYLPYFEDVVRPTESLFKMVPTDKVDWSPVPGAFTCGQLMAHIAGGLSVYAHGITSGDWGFQSMRERFLMNRHTPTMGPDEAIATYHAAREEYLRLVGGLSEEDFQNGEVDAPQFGAKTKRWRVALFAAEHHLNHKAELFMYLKVLGIKVHTGHLYRG